MPATVQFSIDVIKDEARQLLQEGAVSRYQPIYTLCRFVRPGEWECYESELERNDFLLRDQILDLLGREDWQED
jgi:hypothetical protein